MLASTALDCRGSDDSLGNASGDSDNVIDEGADAAGASDAPTDDGRGATDEPAAAIGTASTRGGVSTFADAAEGFTLGALPVGGELAADGELAAGGALAVGGALTGGGTLAAGDEASLTGAASDGGTNGATIRVAALSLSDSLDAAAGGAVRFGDGGGGVSTVRVRDGSSGDGPAGSENGAASPNGESSATSSARSNPSHSAGSLLDAAWEASLAGAPTSFGSLIES